MESINKILVIGSAGSGKTTFSKLLGEKLNLPIIHLDKEYWKAGWVEPSHEEWAEKLENLLLNDKWIMDGNYASTLELRVEKADMIIFLDYNRFVCVNGVLKRVFKNRKKQRDDLPDGCLDKLDFKFLKWVWDFPKKYRPRIIEILNTSNKKIITLKTRKEAMAYLEKINNEQKG